MSLGGLSLTIFTHDGSVHGAGTRARTAGGTGVGCDVAIRGERGVRAEY